MRIFKTIKMKFFAGPAGKVFSAMVMLAGGSSAARLITIMALPALTRLYSPEDFAVLAVFTAIVLMLSPLAAMRYSTSIPLPKHDGLAMNVGALCLLLITIYTILLYVVLHQWGTALFRLLSIESLDDWRGLVALGVFSIAVYEVLSLWATRQRAYKLAARTEVFQAIGGAAIKVLFGLFYPHAIGLLSGQLMSQAGGSLSLWRYFYRQFRGNLRHVAWTRICKLAIRYKGFPLYRVPASFFLACSTHAPIFLASVFFRPEQVGNLSIALIAITLPASLISTNIEKVQFAEAAKLAGQSRQLYLMTRSVYLRTLAISFPISVVMFILAKPLAPLILGEAWELAGIFASILSITVATQLPGQAIVSTLGVVDKNDVFLWFNFTRTFVVVASLSIPPLIGWNLPDTLWAYAIAICIQRLLQALTVLRILESKSSN